MALVDEILYGNAESVAREIAAGDDVNDFDVYGYIPIVEAAIMNKLDVAEVLLKHGADINGKDITGRSALHWAADNNSYDFCKFLLDRHADPNAYNDACQPVLSIPLLRGKEDIKQLLYQYGADLHFAQDFANAKLLGHRFELEGKVHIVDTKGRFILLDFEGFFLESTIAIIQDTIKRYKNNFAARHLHVYFKKLATIINTLAIASELISYQIFTVDLQQFTDRILKLLQHDMLLIPIAYEGHAITCMSYGNLWVKCDRGFNAKAEGSVVIYKVGRPDLLTPEFFKDILYKKHSREYVNQGINQQLALQKIDELPLPAQVVGNCSWANVEGSIPAMLYLMLLAEDGQFNAQSMAQNKKTVLNFFDEWREWDKDRALEECVKSFEHASPARKASKVSLLSAVLVEKFKFTDDSDIRRAEKVFPILATPEYVDILKSYYRVYVQEHKHTLGDNLMNLLDLAAPQHLQLFSKAFEQVG